MEENVIMTREEINNQFKDLLGLDDFSKLLEEVPSIKTSYDLAHRAEYQKQLDAFLQTEIPVEGSEEDETTKPLESDFKFTSDEHSHRFKELYTSFQEKKNEHKKRLAKQEEENFTAKSEVIENLKKLTEEEFNNFGGVFAKFKELQESWKTIGDVNKARFQTLQTEYSHLIDKFFYNVNIHKDLQNYSFDKNSIEKKNIVAKLKELVNNDSIIQLEHYIKKYQKVWDEIGPTSQEDWETIKVEYWEGVNAVYNKIREHYLVIREKQKDSIEKKEKLIEEVKAQFETLKETTVPKQWNELSNKVKELQQDWKKTGFSKKAKDGELWEAFRGVSNQFFDHTKDLYGKLNEKRDGFEEQKLTLIKKAEDLKNSKEWKDTTQKLIKLQESWKKTGVLRHSKDQKLWNKFRGACNEFFDNKKEYFSTLDERQDENLKNKEDISKEIASLKTVEELKEKVSAWWAIGHVPKKAINSSQTNFNSSVEKICKALEIDDNTKDAIVFEAKVKAYKTAENSERLLENEQRFVKERIDKLKDEINQYENNLSFFGNSKGAQKLKEIVDEKINSAKSNLESWQKKMQFLK